MVHDMVREAFAVKVPCDKVSQGFQLEAALILRNLASRPENKPLFQPYTSTLTELAMQHDLHYAPFLAQCLNYLSGLYTSTISESLDEEDAAAAATVADQ